VSLEHEKFLAAGKVVNNKMPPFLSGLFNVNHAKKKKGGGLLTIKC
jgi:hypothetical protein